MLRKTRPYDSLSLEMQFSRSPIFHLLILSHWFHKYVHISMKLRSVPHMQNASHIFLKRDIVIQKKKPKGGVDNLPDRVSLT